MNRIISVFFLLALIMATCKKPQTDININGGEIDDSTEIMVKKYLVKQLLNDDPERVMLSIDWNDDCSKILHVKYGLGYGSLVDYGFAYYGDDSLRITMSLPSDSYPIWELWYDSIVIHFNERRIDSICCFGNGVLENVEHYLYDDHSKLIKVVRNFGDFDTFEWVVDNVVNCKLYGMNDFISIDSFTDYIHPHCNLPFYLASEVAFEVRQPLFTPLWKHMPLWNNDVEFEADEDGYLTKMTQKNSDSWITYYYTTPKQ